MIGKIEKFVLRFLALPAKIKMILIGFAIILQILILVIGTVVVLNVIIKLAVDKTGQSVKSVSKSERGFKFKKKDKFQQSRWYLTDYAREKKQRKKTGSFVVLSEKVDIIQVGQASSTSNILEIPATEAVKVGELPLYYVGQYEAEEQDKVCWLEHKSTLGETKSFYFCDQAGGIQNGCPNPLDSTHNPLLIPAFYSGNGNCNFRKKIKNPNHLLELELIKYGRLFYCDKPNSIIVYRCCEATAPEKIHTYAKMCVASTGILLGGENEFESERMEAIKKLNNLSQETIRKLLLGMITPTMTILMSEAALGKPEQIRKEFAEKETEIRCYTNCKDDIDVHRYREYYLELKFVNGKLESWSEGN